MKKHSNWSLAGGLVILGSGAAAFFLSAGIVKFVRAQAPNQPPAIEGSAQNPVPPGANPNENPSENPNANGTANPNANANPNAGANPQGNANNQAADGNPSSANGNAAAPGANPNSHQNLNSNSNSRQNQNSNSNQNLNQNSSSSSNTNPNQNSNSNLNSNPGLNPNSKANSNLNPNPRSPGQVGVSAQNGMPANQGAGSGQSGDPSNNGTPTSESEQTADEGPQPIVPLDASEDPGLRMVNPEGYVYDPSGRRDPFFPPKSMRGVEPIPMTPSAPTQPQAPIVQDPSAGDPLLAFYLNDFKLIGVLWDVNEPRAMVRAPNNRVYTVQLKMKVGIEQAVVAAIREKEIVLIQPDEQGNYKNGEARTMRMRN